MNFQTERLGALTTNVSLGRRWLLEMSESAAESKVSIQYCMSFCRHILASVEAAVAHGLALVEQGADILDIGGESTRPGAEPVDAAEEIALQRKRMRKDHEEVARQKAEELELGDRFRITGYLSEEEMGTWMAATHLAILPFTDLSASGSMSSWISSGKPMLVSDLPGTRAYARRMPDALHFFGPAGEPWPPCSASRAPSTWPNASGVPRSRSGLASVARSLPRTCRCSRWTAMWRYR